MESLIRYHSTTWWIPYPYIARPEGGLYNIANDRIGLQIRKLIEHDITFDRFIENLKYMKGITFQYFFGTKKSLDYLRKI